MDQQGNFLVYKSSAGSGKTFTLASLFLSLILEQKDPLYFRRILAITFTVKAAAEMKERIITYLSGFAGRTHTRGDIEAMLNTVSASTKLSEDEIRTRSETVLLALVHNYGDLSILTIDKFIHRLVRSFSSDLELTSDFEVEIDQQKLMDSVVEALLEKVGQDEDITKVVMEFVNHQLSDDKSWDVSAQLRTLALELNSEEFFLKSKHFEELHPKTIFEIQRWLDAEISDKESRCKRIGENALQLIVRAGLEAKDFYQGERGIVGYFSKAKDLDLEKVLEPNSYALKSIEEDKWMSGTKNPAVEGVSEQLRTLYQGLAALQPELEKIIFYKRLRPALYSMSLIGELRLLYREVREDENLQTLNDFYRILSERFSQEQTPFIYERLGNRYNHVLIDEFQDTSTLQWQNLLPLVENSVSEGKQSLIVGDAKQSIYRFRGSEPEQFIKLPATGSDADALFKSSYSEHVLNSNFRSSKTIVDFNNRFFTQLKSEFLSSGLNSVYDDLEQIAAKDTEGRIKIHCVKSPEEGIMNYANQIEKRINELTSHEGFNQGDICILFQRNADAAFVAGHLLELGYNVISDESLLLANNHGVQLILSTMKAHANPLDPFVQQQWLARLYQNSIIDENYHKTALRVKESKLSFAQINKELKLDLNLDLLSSGVSFSTAYYLVQRYRLSDQDAFVRKLLDYTLEFDQQAQYLKKSFLTKWEEDSASLSIEVSGNMEAIRIMTIHKSKGLEFPVVLVYLPHLNIRGTTKDFSWITGLRDIPGLTAAVMETSKLSKTPYDEVYQSEKERTQMDLLNSLYVAFTRAERQLEVFTGEKDGKPEPKSLQFITDWKGWDQGTASLVIQD